MQSHQYLLQFDTPLLDCTLDHGTAADEGFRCLSQLAALQDLTLDTLRYDATIDGEFCGLSQLQGLTALRFLTVRADLPNLVSPLPHPHTLTLAPTLTVRALGGLVLLRAQPVLCVARRM